MPRQRLGARDLALENQRFTRRVTSRLAAAGVDQFLVIGAGSVTNPGVHLVLQDVEPSARVVYVSDNRMVLALSRSLPHVNRSRSGGGVGYAYADLRESESILAAPQVRTLDLAQPIALFVVAGLHLIPDCEDPFGLVGRLVKALAPGSYLVISHLTLDYPSPAVDAAMRLYERSGIPAQPRSRAEVEQFFDGLHLLDPGVELVSRWHRSPGDGPMSSPEQIACLAGVGRVQ
ncbi:MAG TPA: SAM-dependent methyltransferase [Kineosporiaceae bacterium]|nr:SAM-dependent methyltransferase [Kineosporiaceae bacterium]